MCVVRLLAEISTVGARFCKTRTMVPHSIWHFRSEKGYAIFHCYEYHLDSLSTVYMKHSYMTRNACTKQQDKKKKAACVLLEQRSIEAYSNLFVALHSGLSNTFSFQLLFSKPRRESSNDLNTLELHTLLRPT